MFRKMIMSNIEKVTKNALLLKNEKKVKKCRGNLNLFKKIPQ